MHRHEIGLGVGFAIFHVVARNHEVGVKDAGVVVVESLEQTVLPTTGDEHYLKTVVLDLAKQRQCTRHGAGCGELVVVSALAFVDMVDFFGRGVALQLLARKEIDGGEASASLVHIDILRGHVESEVFGGLDPCCRVVVHGVVEHSVHVKEHGFEV